MAAADGLTTVEGALHAVYAAEDRALAAIIAAKLDYQYSALDRLRSLLPIRRPSGKLPLIVRIASLPLERGPVPGHPALLVFVSDVSEAPNLSETELQHLFGLSKREAVLVMSLAEGVPLPAAARRMGVSHNTARAHLRDIFAKTGTRSQLQLVRLLCRVPTL